MAIELFCNSCGQKLRVPDEHAGKQARCPQCHATTQISANALSSQPQSPGQDEWYMKTLDGTIYGPVDKLELDRWKAEERLNIQCQLSRGNKENWLSAIQVYPDINTPQSFQSNITSQQFTPSQPSNPFSDSYVQQANNPYTSPAAHTSMRNSQYLPHRGALILTLAIIGLVINIGGCMFCGFIINLAFVIPAWVMADADLHAIRLRRMAPEGMGFTQAGKIISIISCVLSFLFFLFFACIFLVGSFN